MSSMECQVSIVYLSSHTRYGQCAFLRNDENNL